jgi:hypothetical protein
MEAASFAGPFAACPQAATASDIAIEAEMRAVRVMTVS